MTPTTAPHVLHSHRAVPPRPSALQRGPSRSRAHASSRADGSSPRHNPARPRSRAPARRTMHVARLPAQRERTENSAKSRATPRPAATQGEHHGGQDARGRSTGDSLVRTNIPAFLQPTHRDADARRRRVHRARRRMPETTIAVQHNPTAQRFEAIVDGMLCRTDYRMHGDTMMVVHTEVPAAAGRPRHRLGVGEGGVQARRRQRPGCVARVFVRTQLGATPSGSRAAAGGWRALRTLARFRSATSSCHRAGVQPVSHCKLEASTGRQAGHVDLRQRPRFAGMPSTVRAPLTT